MAKSIEEKAVDNLMAAMSSKEFRRHEFSRIMVEKTYAHGKQASEDFMQLAYSFIVYLSVFDNYGFYPYGCQEIAEVAGYVRDSFDEAFGVDLSLTEED